MLFASLSQMDISKNRKYFATETNMIKLSCDKSILPTYVLKNSSPKFILYSKFANFLFNSPPHVSLPWLSKLMLAFNNIEYKNPEFYKSVILHSFEIKNQVQKYII